MTYNLDQMDLTKGPNPPPWWIHYVNDQGGGNSIWYDGVLPEAHTHNLSILSGLEIQIRMAPPNLASFILDQIGLWLFETGEKLNLFDTLIIQGIEYHVVPAFNSDDSPVYRLSWGKDPKPDGTDFIQKFREACAKLGVCP